MRQYNNEEVNAALHNVPLLPTAASLMTLEETQTVTGAKTFTSLILSKLGTAAGIAIDPNAATGDFTLSLSPANITAARRWSFPDRSDTVAGLGAQIFTGRQEITGSFSGLNVFLATNSSPTGYGAAVQAGDGATYYCQRWDRYNGVLLMKLDGNGVLELSATTDATSTTTGALVVAGGIAWGATKTAYGGSLNLSSAAVVTQLFIDNTITGNSSAVYLRDLSSNKYNWLIARQYNINDGLEITPSTAAGGSTYSAPVIYFAPSQVTIPLSTDSTSTTTGALIVVGGIAWGATKTAYGGNLNLAGRATLAQVAGSTTDGNFWSDSTQKGLQTFVSGVEQTLSGCIFTQTATRTIANTVTETSLLTTGVGTLTLPPNFFVAGKTIRLWLTGTVADTGTPTIRLRLKYGATTVIDSTAITFTSLGGTEEWQVSCDLTCRAAGAGGTLAGSVWFTYDTTTGAGTVNGLDIPPTTAIVDTTASGALDLTFEWGTASASNTISTIIASVEVLN